MPITDTATLVISCRADSSGVERYTSAVEKADNTSKQLLSTLGQLFSTAAMVRFGNESIAVFSDLQETTQKFYEVFKGNETEAAIAAKKLEESFGASQRSAKSMLSLTGDLLTGFGFSREEALKLSEQVAQLGSDIASFSNYAGGAEGATGAITKAMLGETEMAKMLGIAIKTDSQEYKELYKQIKATRGTTDFQTKALAALQIAFEQKKTAMGDFERNINSIANRGRMLSNELEDLKANIGRGLSESFSEGQAAGIKLLRVFNDLSPETQDFITKTGAIATGLFAVKAAMATYNTMQAITGSLTAKNAGAVMMEAKAHEENTRAILAENAAKSGGAVGAAVNPIISIGQQIKANKMASDMAKHDLFAARRSNAPVAEIKQLEQNYANILRQRKQLYAMRDMEVMTQQAGKFNTVLTGTNKSLSSLNNRSMFMTVEEGFAKIRDKTRRAAAAVGNMTTARFPRLSAGLKNAQAALNGIGAASTRASAAVDRMIHAEFPTFAAGAAKVRAGLVGIGTAARGAAVAVGSIAKAFLPMLALSAGIAAVDYLMNRSKRAAEAAVAFSEEQAKAAKMDLEVGNQLRQEDEKRLAQYEKLASYSDRTESEQKTLIELAGQLNKAYTSLNVPLLKQNETLKDTSEIMRKMNEEAKRQKLAELQDVMDKANKEFASLKKGYGETHVLTAKVLFDDTLSTFILEESEYVKLARQVFDAKDIDALTNVRLSLVAKGANEEAAYVDKIIEVAKRYTEAKENIKKLINGKDDVFGGNKQESISKTDTLLRDLKNKYFDKQWEIKFNIADPEDKLDLLEEKLKREKEKLAKLPANLERASTDDERKKLKERYKVLEEIAELENRINQERNSQIKAENEKRGALAEKIFAEQERMKKENKNFYESLSSVFSKFRETAQTAVSVNSDQAIRLQSRMFLTQPNSTVQIAKQTSENTKKIADIVKRLQEQEEKRNDVITNIYNYLEQMGISTVGG